MRSSMSLLQTEITDRFGSFRAAWRLEGGGYVTRKRVVGSDWYVFWLFLEGRWEYLPFGTIEGEVDSIPWEPLHGDIEAVATGIGWLVVERVISEAGDKIWWWVIYWRFRGDIYRLSTCMTAGPFVAVV
jgi:hypothetical protein